MSVHLHPHSTRNRLSHRRDILRQNIEGPAVGEGMPFRLRRYHRPRSGLEHMQGRAKLDRCRLRTRRGGTRGSAGREDGRRLPHHRRGHQPGQVPTGPGARRHRHHR